MGCIPTRRINFDVADAVKQKTLIVSHLKKFDAELVDIDVKSEFLKEDTKILSPYVR
jgi:hypothetical protein